MEWGFFFYMTEIDKLTFVLNTQMNKTFTSDEIDYFIILSYLNNPIYSKNIILRPSYIWLDWRLFIAWDWFYRINVKLQNLKEDEIRNIRESIQYLSDNKYEWL